jgi:hypothetical protein
MRFQLAKDHESTQRNDEAPHDGAERLAHADVEPAARQDSVDEPASSATRSPRQDSVE